MNLFYIEHCKYILEGKNQLSKNSLYFKNLSK